MFTLEERWRRDNQVLLKILVIVNVLGKEEYDDDRLKGYIVKSETGTGYGQKSVLIVSTQRYK